MRDIAEVLGKIEAFTRSVSSLWNRESSRYEDEIRDIRVKAYGGSAACVILPVLCPITYATVAPIIETKIKELDRTASNLRARCKDVNVKAQALHDRIEESNKQCT